MQKNNPTAAAARRLRGTWRSDAKKTMSRWVFPKPIAGARLKMWKQLFGKNEWRFTATRLYGSFEGRKSVSAFRIIWADEWSAVLLLKDKDRERVYHLFFHEPWFYILAGRDIVEYFRRVPHAKGHHRA